MYVCIHPPCRHMHTRWGCYKVNRGKLPNTIAMHYLSMQRVYIPLSALPYLTKWGGNWK